MKVALRRMRQAGVLHNIAAVIGPQLGIMAVVSVVAKPTVWTWVGWGFQVIIFSSLILYVRREDWQGHTSPRTRRGIRG